MNQPCVAFLGSIACAADEIASYFPQIIHKAVEINDQVTDTTQGCFGLAWRGYA